MLIPITLHRPNTTVCLSGSSRRDRGQVVPGVRRICAVPPVQARRQIAVIAELAEMFVEPEKLVQRDLVCRVEARGNSLVIVCPSVRRRALRRLMLRRQ